MTAVLTALERSRGEAPVIDFDCAPPPGKLCPFDNRFAALDQLTRLRTEADTQRQPALTTHLDAHIAYLGALIGQQRPLDEYILLTQGCAPRGWTRDYVEQRAWLAQDALSSLYISWDQDAWRNLRSMSEQIPADELSTVIADYAGKYESVIRRLVNSDADFNLTVESVEVDAYWSYWLDGAGHDARLRINKNNAIFHVLTLIVSRFTRSLGTLCNTQASPRRPRPTPSSGQEFSPSTVHTKSCLKVWLKFYHG